MDDDADLKIGLLAASLGALIELLKEARVVILEQRDGSPVADDWLDRVEGFLGPSEGG